MAQLDPLVVEKRRGTREEEKKEHETGRHKSVGWDCSHWRSYRMQKGREEGDTRTMYRQERHNGLGKRPKLVYKQGEERGEKVKRQRE